VEDNHPEVNEQPGFY